MHIERLSPCAQLFLSYANCDTPNTRTATLRRIKRETNTAQNNCNIFGQSQFQFQFCVDSHVQNKTMRLQPPRRFICITRCGSRINSA